MKKRIRPGFTPFQAQRVARAFREAGADFLFIGKSGAILLGFPAITQDLDLFVPKSPENAQRIIRAMRRLGFRLGREITKAIVTGQDFVQIKSGPFDLDLIHAPDGIPSYEVAKARCIKYRGYPIASLKDIIASKRASNREKDLIDLPLLEEFRREYDKLHSPRLRTAVEKALGKPGPAAKKKPRSD
ncbi:MAG: hypothetical protein HYY24_24560 [Verrucomicrobia bacterium]|nr:hypothetical protein [Verrucomicrobiota bacterium]